MILTARRGISAATIRRRRRRPGPAVGSAGQIACRIHQALGASRRPSHRQLDSSLGARQAGDRRGDGWAMGGGFWGSWPATSRSPRTRRCSRSRKRADRQHQLPAQGVVRWKVANRWGLTGDHSDAQEAYRIGIINEAVPHDEPMPRARARRNVSRWCRNRRSGSTRRPRRRASAAGLNAALSLEGAPGAQEHSRQRGARDTVPSAAQQRAESHLESRDGPFLPEPMGPKSKPREKKNGL